MTKILLPGEPQPPQDINPASLIIVSQFKVGKTSLLANLKDCLIVDWESGSRYLTSMSVDMRKNLDAANKGKALTDRVSMLEIINDTLDALEEKAAQSPDGYAYDYIALDTITSLQEYAVELAHKRYLKTDEGRTYKGTDFVADLAYGKGYIMTLDAIADLISYFKPFARKGMIYTVHPKTSSILKDGVELQTNDLNLMGKIKSYICKEVDAIGFLYRRSKNKNHIVFKQSKEDMVLGNRPTHLWDKDFLISETEDGVNITCHWDKIYLPQNV